VKPYFCTLCFLVSIGASSGCRTIEKTPDSILTLLREKPTGFVSGIPLGISKSHTLNREDFVYDAAIFPDSQQVASTRLGPKSFHLNVYDVSLKQELAPKDLKSVDVVLNPLEFDVESLAISPDGTMVATASKDGALRIHSKEGKPVGRWLTEEPLVSVAWHPNGSLIALGSVRGLLTLVSFPQLQFVAEIRAHNDELRALTFGADGLLYSGSWDKHLNVYSIIPTTNTLKEVRLRVTAKSGLNLFGAVFNSAALASTSTDVRYSLTVIKPALAQAAGINVGNLKDEITLATSNGNQLVRVAKNQTISLKGILFSGIDVAICDACVPTDAQAVLGQNMLSKIETAMDSARNEMVIAVKADALDVLVASAHALSQIHSFEFAASVNDVSIDAKGTTLGVAFSETKAERNKEVYDREKKNLTEPKRDFDCAARVSALTGEILEKKYGHLGVVSSVGISPDGTTLVSGGWDKKVILHAPVPIVDDDFGWALRKVRFSRNGLLIVAAAWTPQNPLNDHQSNDSLVLYNVIYKEAVVQ
jgi:WD40 repeat protein